MRQFLIKVCLVALSVVLYFGCYLKFMPMDYNNYLYMQNIKDSLMQNTPSPRLLMVSGSSFAFGLDSKRMSDSLHVNVINVGLHAGVGMKLILENVNKYVRDGDVVMIGMEYEHLVSQMYGDAATLGPALYYTGYRNLKLLNDAQLLNVITGIPTTIRMNKISLRTPDQAYYSVKGFNGYGDEVGHFDHKADKVAFVKMNGSAELNPEYCQCFLDIVHQMEGKGAKILFVAPPFASSCINLKTAHETLDFLRANSYDMLVEPEEAMLPDSLFYDSSYHLGKNGVDEYTKILIDTLKNIICFSTHSNI